MATTGVDQPANWLLERRPADTISIPCGSQQQGSPSGIAASTLACRTADHDQIMLNWVPRCRSWERVTLNTSAKKKAVGIQTCGCWYRVSMTAKRRQGSLIQSGSLGKERHQTGGENMTNTSLAAASPCVNRDLVTC